jgi:tellurium resistance protein TerZ
MPASLTKEDGANPLYADPSGAGAVTTLELGLSWDAKGQDNSLRGKYKRAVRKAEGKANPGDMDGIAVFLVGEKPVKYLGFDNVDCFKTESEPGANGSAVHSGDNLTGEGEGDDEVITLHLDRIPKRITRIILTAGGFKVGTDIGSVDNVTVKLYDRTGGTPTEVAVIEPSLLRPKRMLAIARVDRVPGTRLWELSVIEDSFDFTAGDMNSFLSTAMRMQ